MKEDKFSTKGSRTLSNTDCFTVRNGIVQDVVSDDVSFKSTEVVRYVSIFFYCESWLVLLSLN